MDIPGKIFELKKIMGSVHALADKAWPDGIPEDATRLIIDIQEQFCKAVGLPEDTDLTL